jgi:hypothetical protein
LKFRIFIFKDPDAHDRGCSLAGIKVPLTSFAPVQAQPEIKSYDEGSAFGPYADYWKIPVCLLILVRPDLKPHLRGLGYMLVPTDWCSIDPVASWTDLDTGV